MAFSYWASYVRISWGEFLFLLFLPVENSDDLLGLGHGKISFKMPSGGSAAQVCLGIMGCNFNAYVPLTCIYLPSPIYIFHLPYPRMDFIYKWCFTSLKSIYVMWLFSCPCYSLIIFIRCNWHKMKWTDLKSIVWWVLTNVYVCCIYKQHTF